MQRKQIKNYIASPLNYQGGKARILDQLLPYFPADIDVFVDLFCGGCNVGMNVNAEKVIYNDCSKQLIGLLRAFRRMKTETIIGGINKLIEEFGFSQTRFHNFAYYGGGANLGVSKYNRDKYLLLRERFNTYPKVDNHYYILLYTLILFGFNNQIRFNDKGQFNLPVGKRDFNLVIEAKLVRFLEALHKQNCEIRRGDFRSFDFEGLTSNSIVYCDPPYLITTATYNEKDGWTEKDEVDLLSLLDGLNEKGIKFALEKTELGISYDSILYLGQLLKTSQKIGNHIVRPLIVILYLLSELDYFSFEEFRYLVPLCTDEFSTSYVLELIKQLRAGKGSIDDVIKEFLLSKPNYKMGLERFEDNEFSPELLLSVSMNRKSANYDKPYVAFYEDLYAVCMESDYSRLENLFDDLKNFQSSIAIKWKKLLFNSTLSSNVKKRGKDVLKVLPAEALQDEKSFRRFFFLTMHLFKAKATLEDYLDLNRRYLGLTNCFIFADEQVKLDIVPKQFFANAIEALYKDAYVECPRLKENCSMVEINPALVFDKQSIIKGVNKDLGTSISTIDEAFDEVDKVRYQRLNKMIDIKFTDTILERLLDDFEKRNDDEINQLVTDNADIPTIFEYVLGIVWYKVSGRKGKLLHYLKLSLDANLLPITHAAGGEADIVYEYQGCAAYPNHGLLLEATLADGTNQRRMEMEPVSRHLGRYLLRTRNKYSYCIFATSYLDVNVINDFMGRKQLGFYDPSDSNNYVDSLKIIPLCTKDLKLILKYSLSYDELYELFEKAYEANERHPQKWYDNYVSIETACEALYRDNRLGIAADPIHYH